MREALFIKKNKDRWERIKHLPSDDIDEMAEEFTQLTDDLGYAKTFYPHSKITRFLNAEASSRYLSIYKNRKEEKNRIVTFFKYDVPQTVGKHHTILLLCFILFVSFLLLGFLSSVKDENFVREMLGDAYVNESQKNIDEGNPFGIYQTGSSIIVWLGIMVNNISVSFTFFAKGLLFFYFLIDNLITEGLRLGAFEQMFFARKLGLQSLLTIMIHGTLELSALIISAQAGIVLGKSWMFPGTVSRLAAFKQGAKEGIKIITGLIPVFITAAFFESFVTRTYNIMPLWLNILILAASLSFVIWYFVVYPIQLKRKFKIQATA